MVTQGARLVIVGMVEGQDALSGYETFNNAGGFDENLSNWVEIT